MAGKKGKKKKKKKKKKQLKLKNRGILKILWDNIRGQYRESIESGEFKGLAKVKFLNPGRILLVGLVSAPFGPAAPVVAPFVDFVFGKALNVVWETAKDVYQGYGTFELHTTKSGLALLKNPKVITPLQTFLKLKNKIEIPSKLLIRPDEDQIYRPTYSLNTLFSRLETKPNKRTQPSFIEANQISQNPDQLSSLLKTQSKSGSSLTDVLYQDWVFSGKITLSDIQGQRTRTPKSFAEWYQNEPSYAKKNLEKYAALNNSRRFQENAAQARKYHQNIVKRSQEISRRNARKSHEGFQKRIKRYNNLTKPPGKR
jgi:hypothetical protein